jgi:DNA-binding protein HU-beta
MCPSLIARFSCVSTTFDDHVLWRKEEKMNKKDLVAAVADDADLTKDQAGAAVDAVIHHIQNALQDGDEVRIAGFGSFKVSDRKATTARNPRTGETVEVPASRVPKFQAARGLKEALNP